MADREKPLVRVDGRDPKQCVWKAMRGSGPGGQHRNKTSNAARVTHLPSGASAQASEHKSLERNKREAWKRLGANKKFRAWLKRESAKALGITARIEREVKEAMRPHNLKIECRGEDGRWESYRDEKEDGNGEQPGT